MDFAVRNGNDPAFTCVPARGCDEPMVLVDDLSFRRIAAAKLADGQELLRVSLDA